MQLGSSVLHRDIHFQRYFREMSAQDYVVAKLSDYDASSNASGWQRHQLRHIEQYIT